MITGMIESETGEPFACGLGRDTCRDTSDCGGNCERFGFCEAEVRPSSIRLRPGDVLPVPHGQGERWTVVSVEADDYSRTVNSDGSTTTRDRVGSATMRHADGSESVNPFHNGSTIVHSINLVRIRKEKREKRERWAAEAHECEERLRNRTCAVGWCEEGVGVTDHYARYCAEHSRDEPDEETPAISRLRAELDELQGSILNLAGVALAPYVRALGALDDARRVMGVAQDANNERYEELPSLLETIVIYEGEVSISQRGEVKDESWEPARARVHESFAGVQGRLRDLKRLRRKVARQALAAGLENKIKAALVYAGVDEGERA